MSSTASTRVYRPSLSEHEITAVIEVLQYQNRTHGLDLVAKAAMVKFQKLAVDFEHNTRAPSYVATGVKRQSAVNLTALGATAEELAIARLTPDQLTAVKLECYEYEGTYQTVLPLHRFIGKTCQQVRNEEVGLADVKVISDVEVHEVDPNANSFADMFGKL